MLRNFFLLFPLYSCRFLDILFSILSSKSENGRTMQNRHYKIVLDRVILLTIFDAIKAEAIGPAIGPYCRCVQCFFKGGWLGWVM